MLIKKIRTIRTFFNFFRNNTCESKKNDLLLLMKLSIISVEDPKGGYDGYLKDRPEIKAKGATYEKMVENLIELVHAHNEYEQNKKK